MPLIVHTARISSRDPDALDVTRRTGGPIGSLFAPSRDLLADSKSGRLSFEEYAPRYVAEMREGYGTRTIRGPHRGAWEELLARPRVVCTCYCVDPEACHRSLLAGILSKLGAEVRGEVGLSEAVAAVRAAGASGKITVREVVTATDQAGAELCVVWTVLHRSGVVALSYDGAKAGGLLAAVRKLRQAKAQQLGAG